MGGNMARRLLAGGYTVHGEAQSRDGAEDLIAAGLEWHDTPKELAESVDVVFASLPDDAVLQEVGSGAGGILAGLEERRGVDMSRGSPDVSRELAQQARAQGGWMLNAPVSGSVPQVQSG